ncbi:hypothetical protein JB92DRAFT_2902178 [Gautieria morchelliformis]|nr:hypothetical protein JB92DRAFT_2902178 [Gautieria morchelliformis]
MAEALAGLGVAASVIAVVQLGETVISTCSAYGTTYKNASKDMKQLSDEIWRILVVLKAIHELIKGEEAKTSTRLPTLIAALNRSYDHQIHDSPAEEQGLENELGLKGGHIDSTPNVHARRRGVVKSFWKKLKSKELATTVETKGGHTKMGNALEEKDGDTEGMPRALAGFHAELDRLLNKIKSEDGRTSRKKALAWTFRQGEVRKTRDNLRRFYELVNPAFLVDQTKLALMARDENEADRLGKRRQDIYHWLSAPDYQ